MSTGPRSDAGKAVSARNGLAHGLSGSGLLLPAAEAQKANGREAALSRELDPRSESERILVRQMAVFHVRAEQARAMQIEARTRIAQRAETVWGDDRKAEALDVAAKLSADPERVVQRLVSTLEGAVWLSIRWRALRNSAETAGDWTPEQRARALDLLGIPFEIRDAIPHPFEADEPETARQRRIDLARGELERIEERILHVLRHLDADDQGRAARGLEPADDRTIRLYRRYERDAQRRFEWAWREFHQRRKAEAATSSTAIESVTNQTQIEVEATGELSDSEPFEPMDEEISPLEAASEEPTSADPTVWGNRRARRAAEARRRKAERGEMAAAS